MKEFLDKAAKSADLLDDLLRASKIHGDGFVYQHAKGTQPDLRQLKPNQRVCASGIKGMHILMTQK